MRLKPRRYGVAAVFWPIHKANELSTNGKWKGCDERGNISSHPEEHLQLTCLQAKQICKIFYPNIIHVMIKTVVRPVCCSAIRRPEPPHHTHVPPREMPFILVDE